MTGAGSIEAPRSPQIEARLEDLTDVTTASRGFAGDSDAWVRRTEPSASNASADSASLAVAVDDRDADDPLAEFDRRVALLLANAAEHRRFALADFAEEQDSVVTDGGSGSLSVVLRESGPMPAEVAEECVRGALASLRSAHDRRWSHGRLSFDAFLLDRSGVIGLTGVGRLQREILLGAAAEDRRDGVAFKRSESRGERWNDAFATGAAEDFRRLGPMIVSPLLQGIDGPNARWSERLVRCLEGLDGAVGSLEDVDHAWRSIDACFRAGEAVELPSPVAFERHEPDPSKPAAIPAAVETPAAPLSADEAPRAGGASRIVLFWFCVVGGLAAMAGTLATVIVGR